MLKRALVQASPVWQSPELRRQYDLASSSLRKDISGRLEAPPLRGAAHVSQDPERPDHLADLSH